VQHVHAEFGLEIGYVLSENSCMTLPYTRTKGVTTATNFGTKIATKAFLRDNENVITCTYNREFSWSANLEISDCKN